MKLTFTLIAALLFCINAFSQTAIKLGEINDHIGDSVKLQAKIYGIKYLSKAKGAPTFISLGAAYPHQLLTIVIWQDEKEKMSFDFSQEKFIGGVVVVTGKLELYKGKAQIVINNPKQFDVLYDEEVKLSELPKIDQQL